MKRILLLTFLFILTFPLFSQAPTGYYNGTENLRGKALKHALYEIIKGQTEYPYTSSSTDVWDILKKNRPRHIVYFEGRKTSHQQYRAALEQT